MSVSGGDQKDVVGCNSSRWLNVPISRSFRRSVVAAEFFGRSIKGGGNSIGDEGPKTRRKTQRVVKHILCDTLLSNAKLCASTNEANSFFCSSYLRGHLNFYESSEPFFPKTLIGLLTSFEHMKRPVLILAVVLMGCSTAQINQALSDFGKSPAEVPPTASEVAEGLKEALLKGVSIGTEQLAKTNGYLGNPEIRIPFPPDVKKVEDRLRQLGLGSEVDKFVTTLNHGAEDAAREAKPIFYNAIQALTIQDAWSILKGEPDAATQYLKRTTSTQLKEKFKPVIQNSLSRVNATKYYGDLVNTYNRIPMVEKVNPNLDDYATDLAIQGLFTMIAKEEMNIRRDPVARTTDILKRVFSYQN